MIKRENLTILSVLLSTIVILITIGIAWGEVHATVTQLTISNIRIEGRVDKLEVVVREHHDDQLRHVDANWKVEIQGQLREIRDLVMKHMADSTTRARGTP
jgi:hypothetical protein